MRYGYDMGIFTETGLKIPIQLDLSDHCNLLLTGCSGSGKSYALLYLLGSVLKSNEDIEIFFCDFKNSYDFSFLEDYPHYYSGDNCYEGITEYYRVFCSARQQREFTKKHLLICDEYPALVNYLQGQDKLNKTKYASEVLSAISELLCLG